MVLLLSAWLFCGSLGAQSPAGPQETAVPTPGLTPPAVLRERLADAQGKLAALDLNRWKMTRKQGDRVAGDLRSVDENFSTQLPVLLGNQAQHPESVSVRFLLYRDLSALYDVLLRIGAVAEEKAPSPQRQALEQAQDAIGSLRANLGEEVADGTRADETRIVQLEDQVRSASRMQAAPVCPTVVPSAAPQKRSHKPK